MAVGGEALDERDHVADVIGGFDDVLGALEAQGGSVVEEGLDEDGGEFTDGFTGGGGLLDDAVVDIGEIHDVVQAVTPVAQPAAEDVLEGKGAQIADMSEIPDGGAAGVHADGDAIEGREVLDALGEGVVEADGHSGCDEAKCIS